MNFTPHHSKKKNNQRKISAFFHRIGRDAYVDWAIIFSLTFVLSIAVVIVGYSVYVNTNKVINKPIPQSTATRKAIFDEKQLETVISKYDQMKSEWERLKTGYDGPSDPSL